MQTCDTAAQSPIPALTLKHDQVITLYTRGPHLQLPSENIHLHMLTVRWSGWKF